MSRDGDAIQTDTPTFVTTPDSDMALTTWLDIGRHPELKISATNKVILSSRCRPMQDHVNSVVSESDFVKNVAVTVEIMSSSISIQNLSDTSVLAVAILDFPLPVFAGSGTNGSRGMEEPQSEPIGFEISLIPYLEASMF